MPQYTGSIRGKANQELEQQRKEWKTGWKKTETTQLLTQSWRIPKFLIISICSLTTTQKDKMKGKTCPLFCSSLLLFLLAPPLISIFSSHSEGFLFAFCSPEASRYVCRGRWRRLLALISNTCSSARLSMAQRDPLFAQWPSSCSRIPSLSWHRAREWFSILKYLNYVCMVGGMECADYAMNSGLIFWGVRWTGSQDALYSHT